MDNYIIKNGDVIRLMDQYAVNGQVYFTTEITEDGRYIAHPMNGAALDAFPCDTIDYIRIDGVWWEVTSIHCEWETIQEYDNITYDLDEIKPCANCVLEKEFHELQV